MNRVFLLSPANCGGKRAQLLLRNEAQFELALRLRAGTAQLGEIFSFLSGLYFRGKLAYAQTFASPPAGAPGVLVITTNRGLLSPKTLVCREDLDALGSVPIDQTDARYTEPLSRDAQVLASEPISEVVLLGSIATRKYLDPLCPHFGDRLRFPAEFVGRGDMSRGGLLLRSAAAGIELLYRELPNLPQRGERPPRLGRLPRSDSALNGTRITPASRPDGGPCR